MSLKFSIQNWKLPFHHVSNNLKVHCSNFNGDALVIISDHKQTVLLKNIQFHRDASPTRLTIVQDDSSKCLFDVSGKTFNIYKNDNVLQRLEAENEGQFFWKKIEMQFPTIITAIGIPDGIAAIVEIDGSYYVHIYHVTDDVITKKIVTHLPKCLAVKDDRCFFLARAELSLAFKRHIFGDIAFACSDVIVIGQPSGFVVALPLVRDGQGVEPAPLHYEVGTLRQVFTNPDLISLIYESGKIVLLSPSDRRIDYHVHYLPWTIRTAVVSIIDCDLYIVSSDTVKIRMARIRNFTQLMFCHMDKELYGVQHIFRVGDEIIAMNVNCLFYALTISEDAGQGRSSSDLNSFWRELTENPELPRSIATANEQINALECEQLKSGNLTVNLIADILTLDNKSKKTFSKNFWRVQVDAVCSDGSSVEVFELERDLPPDCSISFPVSTLLKSNCSELDVALIGDIDSNSRDLYCHVGTIPIPHHESDRNEIGDKIAKICELFRGK